MDLEELKQIITQEIEKEVEKTIKNLCEKYNVNVEEASKFIMKKEVKRGRPAKEEDPEEIKEKWPRGRPPKTEKEITNYSGEDLISRLLEEARKKAGIVQ